MPPEYDYWDNLTTVTQKWTTKSYPDKIIDSLFYFYTVAIGN